MSNTLDVRGPIEIKDSTKERVAYDLMKIIDDYDQNTQEAHKNKKYWLTLYRQCLKATAGYTLESILSED